MKILPVEQRGSMRTKGQMDGQTDRHTDRQTHRQTDRQTWLLCSLFAILRTRLKDVIYDIGLGG